MSRRRSSFADKTKLLLEAVKAEDLNTVTSLCNAGTDVNAQDPYGNTPLMLAADRGLEDIVEELITVGAKPNLQDKYGQTALIFAAFRGHWTVAKFLLEHKARANVSTKHGQTALMKAAYTNSLSIVSLLFSSRADVNAQDSHGRSALMIAAVQNNYNVVEYLALIAKAQLDLVDGNGDSAIMLAARYGNMAIVELLASVGANRTITNAAGQTVESVAPENGNTALAEHHEAIAQAIKAGLAAAKKAKKEGLSIVPRRIPNTEIITPPPPADNDAPAVSKEV